MHQSTKNTGFQNTPSKRSRHLGFWVLVSVLASLLVFATAACIDVTIYTEGAPDDNASSAVGNVATTNVEATNAIAEDEESEGEVEEEDLEENEVVEEPGFVATGAPASNSDIEALCNLAEECESGAGEECEDGLGQISQFAPFVCPEAIGPLGDVVRCSEMEGDCDAALNFEIPEACSEVAADFEVAIEECGLGDLGGGGIPGGGFGRSTNEASRSFRHLSQIVHNF